MLCSIVKPRNRGRPSCQLGHLPDSHGALFAAELTSAAESSTCQTSKGRNTSSSVLQMTCLPVSGSVHRSLRAIARSEVSHYGGLKDRRFDLTSVKYVNTVA